MSTQMINWALFIVPWLTIFFMKREDIKRYMPVALFATILSTVIYDTGITLRLWVVQETVFPFNEMATFVYGAMPVITLWVFKFTYGRFLIYALTNLILDIGFNFFFLNIFLPSNWILILTVSPFQTLPITLMHALLIYGYQMWQEGVFAQAERADFTHELQPEAAKPLPEAPNSDNKTTDDATE